MSIGEELNVISEILKRSDGEVPADWKYIDYFSLVDFQPTREAFRVLMGYEDFWALEPPVLAVHVTPTLLAENYYSKAIHRTGYQSLVTFGGELDEQTYHFEAEEDWVVPHLISFCDLHVISDSSDSWWGAILSDDQDVIYPSFIWNEDVPPTWEGIE